MDIGDLKAFLAVAESGHFGRAAKRLNISAAQVSQRISRLEKHLKVELISRTTRSVSITPIGQELVSEGKKLLTRILWVEEYIERLGSGGEGVLRIGAISSVSYSMLPRITQAIDAAMPGVKIRISAGLFTPTQEQALEDRAIDMGILRLPVRKPGINYRIIARDPLVLVLSTAHPLAGKTDITIQDLENESFVTYPNASGSVVRESVFRVCERVGFQPQSLVEVSETSTLIGLVASGMGVALVPRSVEALRTAGVRYVDLGLQENLEIAIAWRSDDHSLLLTRLLEVLEQAGIFIDTTKTYRKI